MGKLCLLIAVSTLLLTGCRRKKPVVRFDDQDGGTDPFVGVTAGKPGPPPKKNEDPPPDRARAGAAPRRRITSTTASSSRPSAPPPGSHEPPMERPGDEPLRAQASSITAPGPAGPPPDELQNLGHPEVRRPDELVPLPTERPQRYVSPAALKKVLSPQRIPQQPMADIAPDEEKPALDVSAHPAAFPPQPTAALNDEVPDTVVSDPNELGSYHVQVSSNPLFEKLIFNKVYPFMADIDLKTDLSAAGTKPGQYWIRYALVDLLGFEHPFTKPQRFLLETVKR